MAYRDQFELQARIQELEEENAALTLQNQELRFQRDVSTRLIDTLRKVSEDLQGNQARLTLVIIALLLSMAASSIHSSFWK